MIPNKPAEFYFDMRMIPVAAHDFKENNNDTSESDKLVDGDPITIPKLDKAQSFSLDFMFFYDHIFYAANNYSSVQGGFSSISDLKQYFRDKKQNRDPMVLTIIYPTGESVNLKTMLKTYSVTQSASNASDYEVSITFDEYCEALNLETNTGLQNSLIRNGLRSARSVS